MYKNNLIACFYDTLDVANSFVLHHTTRKTQKNSRVYKENFSSKRRRRKVSAEIIVEEITSFSAAKKYIGYGKTAVLNFANPETPGGGVQNGAMAQEECLCRSSNLYPCLQGEKVWAEYYEYHRNMRNFLYSDRVVYTPNITVFKDDNVIPCIMPKREWFRCDIITCAAPYMGTGRRCNTTVLKNVFKQRIRNIFEVAFENGIDVIILGAFGCGAFKNPPEIVAQAFYEVIRENKYDAVFKKIVFAIKRSAEGTCPNIMAFENVFASKKLTNITGQHEMQKKQFSILGDSISTLDGYNPKGYKVFYHGENMTKNHVSEIKDTWWGQVIDYFGGELLVNNSYSGSRVTRFPNSESVFPAGCSDVRADGLHLGSIRPDVIIVYLGTNDWAFGATLAYLDYLGEEITPYSDSFEEAYDQMLLKLTRNYPDAEIWCCTITTTFISNCPSFHFPHSPGGNHIEEYNQIIRSAIRLKKNCHLIDLYDFHLPYDTLDGSHPTREGMQTIASMVIKSMDEKLKNE